MECVWYLMVHSTYRRSVVLTDASITCLTCLHLFVHLCVYFVRRVCGILKMPLYGTFLTLRGILLDEIQT